MILYVGRLAVRLVYLGLLRPAGIALQESRSGVEDVRRDRGFV